MRNDQNRGECCAKYHSTKSQAYQNITVCPHPLCSQDLALCLLGHPQNKSYMRGRHFESIQDSEVATDSTTKDVKHLQRCFRKWQQ